MANKPNFPQYNDSNHYPHHVVEASLRLHCFLGCSRDKLVTLLDQRSDKTEDEKYEH